MINVILLVLAFFGWIFLIASLPVQKSGRRVPGLGLIWAGLIVSMSFYTLIIAILLVVIFTK